MRPRQASSFHVSVRVFVGSCIALYLSGSGFALPVPFAVSKGELAKAFDVGQEHQAALAWDDDALHVEIRVADATPGNAKKLGLAPEEAYRADSVEFWVGRRQFGITESASGPLLYDYVLQREVPDSTAEWVESDGGYVAKARLPWTQLDLEPTEGMSLPVAIQINDHSPGTEKVAQTFFPKNAVWDRPSTYGLITLQGGEPHANAVSALVAPVALDIRDFAYETRTEALIRRQPPFEDSALRLELEDSEGKVFHREDIPAGSGAIRIDLPWVKDQRGIFRANLFLVIDGKAYGPISEPYFNGGDSPIAETKSPRQPPEDLESFWLAKISAMREVEFDAEELPVESPSASTTSQKFRITNHRGNPMIVYVSRHSSDGDAELPFYLNVYPPMCAEAPPVAQPGYVTVTACGSLVGDARLPGQEKNETLWVRAESLDDSYWLDVVLDGIRVMDFVTSQPLVAPQGVVTGGSRGGWYALTMAALAPDRVALAGFASPCYSDVTMNRELGHGSAASEVHRVFFRDEKLTDGRVFANFRYFDPLFLTTLLKTDVVFSGGLRDQICSAIGMTAAANNIPDKQQAIYILDADGGHGGSPATGAIRKRLARAIFQPSSPNE